MKINNNDSKKSNGYGDPPSGDRLSLNSLSSNGHSINLDEGKEDEAEEDEVEAVEERGVSERVMARLDSGSDTDEFCDTSDQMIQIPTKLPGLQASLTSTPLDSKREMRVRFAPHLHKDMASGDGASVCSNSSDHSAEMMASRMGLGTATGLSFLPQNTTFAPHTLTESLCVNNSFSSLASLAGNDSVAGDLGNDDNNSIEEDTTLDDGGLTFNPGSDLVTRRGGGEEGSGQGSRGSQLGGHSGGAGFTGSGREADRSRRRDLFPHGSSGSGGQSPGSEGRPQFGHLDEQILLTLIRLQQDMADISKRLASLELTVKLQREEQAKKAVKHSKWWPFSGMSKTMVFLLVAWPFLAPFLMNVLCQRRRSHR